MKNENIVLISLYDPQSFAIRILHAVLAARGFKVYSIAFKDQNKDDSMDYPDPREISILIDKIKGLNPVFVGISLRSTLFRLAVHLTEKIKAATGTFVVWGIISAWRQSPLFQHIRSRILRNRCAIWNCLKFVRASWIS